MEIGEGLKLREIETASSLLKTCPNCSAKGDFWLGIKGDHLYAQCKCCGLIVEVCDVQKLGGRPEKQRLLRFLKK